MGYYNYLIIPELELRIQTKLNVGDFGGYSEQTKERYDKLFNNEELEQSEYGGLNYPNPDEVKLKELGELTISDATNMFKICKIAEGVSNPMYFEEILCYYLNCKGIEFFTLSETQEDELEKYKSYKLIEIKY